MSQATATMTARVPRAERHLAEAAAEVSGLPLSRFVGEAVRREALRVFLRAEPEGILLLHDADPPPP